jgi:hypothetical protein
MSEKTSAIELAKEQLTAQAYTSLNDALVGIIQSATEAKSFLEGQVPDVVHQLLVYHMCAAWFWTLWLVPVCIVWGYFVKTLIKKEVLTKKGWEQEAVSELLAMVVSVILIALTLIFFLMNIEGALKVTFAPKVFLIEYMANLVR